MIWNCGMYLAIIRKNESMKKILCLLTVAIGLSIASVSTTNAQTTVKEKQKKGMSGKAKGAIIGGVGGAVVGGAVGGGKGAVIGGVAGAGVGYAVGAHHDKKHPRKKIYKKKVETR
jgi:osmotically inducible lipoprotein OsmB